MPYTLNIELSSSDLEQIYASGQTIVLTKGVQATAQTTPVAWVALRPLQSNQIRFESSYQAFASNTQIMNGVTINPSAQASVGFGQCIPYAQSGFGQPETGACPSTSMSVLNIASNQTITCGLSQVPTVNGATLSAAPICATSLMYQMQANFTPIETVSIFLYGYTNAGTVMSHLPSNVSTYSFNTSETSISVRYDSASGKFVSA